MSCAQPPELKERDLLAYVDGQAGPEIAAHLERCPHCRDRATRLARFEGRLTAALYRAACPPPHELGEYHLDLLPAARAAAVRDHLAACPHCAAEVAQLHGYLDDLAPDITPGVLDQAARRVRVLLARLVAGGPAGLRLGPPALAPAVRGAAGGPLVYQAGSVQVAVEVQPDAGAPGLYTLLGLVSGLAATGRAARLERGVGPGASAPIPGAAPVDELGNFVLAGISPGTYDLVISGPDLDIRLEALDLAAP